MACTDYPCNGPAPQGASERKRKGIGRRVRFEVFKRDGFACQYCGAHPPAVVLEVDHIHPVALGGGNDVENLITACFPCNRGKAARPLSDAPPSLAAQAARVREMEDQLAGYAAVMAERRDRREAEAWEAADALNGGVADTVSRKDFAAIVGFVDRLSGPDTVDAAEIAFRRYPFEARRRFLYFCGICWRCIREGSTPKDGPQ